MSVVWRVEYRIDDVWRYVDYHSEDAAQGLADALAEQEIEVTKPQPVMIELADQEEETK